MSADYELDFGDCEDRMATMGDKSVDVIITDPPYSEHTHKAGRRSGGVTAAGNPCVRVADLGFAHLTREDVFRLSLPFARLARRWVVVFSDHELGETIFDPFAGSGTAGVAALQNGRRFHGCEKQEKYIAIARERLDAAAEGLDLASARAKQVPMFGGAA